VHANKLPLAGRATLQGTATTKYLQPLHHWFRPWSICRSYYYPHLHVQLRPTDRTVSFLLGPVAWYHVLIPIRRTGDVDLEREFEPSLLNSAVYLLQLIQQISTFAINYQGRPFRESIRENRGMYWGLVLVSSVAFSCSTEFIPEMNQKLKLVKFSNEFKFTITSVMILDYACCWLIEKALKHLFSDFRPRDIAVRRKDQIQAEERRRAAEKLEEESKKLGLEAAA
jgi:hypothetical protein